MGLETCKACWDQTPPQDQTPLEQGTPWDQAPHRASTRRTRHPPGPGTPQDQAPPGTRHPPDQPHLPVNRITDTCKNITLTQTSFAGGKNVHMNLNQFTCDLTYPWLHQNTYIRLYIISYHLHHFRFQWDIDLVDNFIVLITFPIFILFQILIFVYLFIICCTFRNTWNYKLWRKFTGNGTISSEVKCFVIVTMTPIRPSYTQ